MNKLHDSIERAFDEIDAGFFSSDAFHSKEDIKRAEYFIERWQNQISNINESELNDLSCPVEAIDNTLAFATKDWSADKNDAWIYGIVAGWDDAALEEFQLKFGWSNNTVAELKRLHKACNELRA